MLALSTRVFDLPLRHVFRIARGAVSVQRTFVVTATLDGFTGFGEATENSYYGATAQAMAQVVANAQHVLKDWQPEDPSDAVQRVATAVGNVEQGGCEAFALSAIDAALHDLWGKSCGASTIELLNLDSDTRPQSNYTIGIDTIDKMVEKLQEAPGWPCYKIKLGTDEDLQIVRELRKHTDAVFRVDANCGWTAEKTIELSKPLQELGVEFIEQPLPADQSAAMPEVLARSALPLIADESCVNEADVERCVGKFTGINIKLCKCGGMSAARRMIRVARKHGLKVMVGCMTESSIGISAIAQLSPLLDYVDMDGAELLAADLASGAKVKQGFCTLPTTPGLGIELLPQASQHEVL